MESSSAIQVHTGFIQLTTVRASLQSGTGGRGPEPSPPQKTETTAPPQSPLQERREQHVNQTCYMLTRSYGVLEKRVDTVADREKGADRKIKKGRQKQKEWGLTCGYLHNRAVSRSLVG